MISIIIPTYNRADIIGNTLDSICNQTYTNWECIIVDDGSSDSTTEFIEPYLKDERVSFISNTRKKGAPGARNTGLLNANGEFIYFFDSDNIMKPNTLELLLGGIIDSRAGVCTCFAEVLNDKDEQINSFTWKSNGDISTKILSGETYVDYNISIIRKSILDKYGLTDEECPAYQEWDTHIRLSQLTTYHTIEEPLIIYYQRAKDTISSDKRRSAEGFLYVLSNHLKRFRKHPDLFRKQGEIFLRTAEMINDKAYLAELQKKLNILIPGFEDYLRKNSSKTYPTLRKRLIDCGIALKRKTMGLISVFSIFSKTKSADAANVGYIDCATTVQAAEDADLSICEFVERLWDQYGQTKLIMNRAAKHVDFSEVHTVCEIGPGTGRYVKKTIERMVRVDIYAIYETAQDWANWLEKEYPVKKRNANGVDLREEEDSTIDFCQAHGVFVSLSIYNTLIYIQEMTRVLKKGGHMLFDYLDENSFSADVGQQIIKNKIDYPSITPSDLVKNFLKENDCEIIAEFTNKYGKGHSNYILARKKS